MQMNLQLVQQNLMFTGPRVTFYQVNDLEQLLEVKRKMPDSKLVVGNTELGKLLEIYNDNL